MNIQSSTGALCLPQRAVSGAPLQPAEQFVGVASDTDSCACARVALSSLARFGALPLSCTVILPPARRTRCKCQRHDFRVTGSSVSVSVCSLTLEHFVTPIRCAHQHVKNGMNTVIR